ALLPTSSVVPLAEVMNDHRVLFPYVGLTLAACWAAGLAFTSTDAKTAARGVPQYAVIALAVAALAVQAYGTRQRNAVWHDGESLWRDVARKSPENGRGLMNYGVALMGRGEYALAEDYFHRALQYNPQYSYLHVNLGILNGAMGRPAEAERYFRQAQAFDPQNPEVYVSFGRWLLAQGRRGEAIEQLTRALQVSPGDIDARTLLQQIQR